VAAPFPLQALSSTLVVELDAEAAVISRVLGDVLIQLTEHVVDGSTMMLGQGYLASDFPLTVSVLADRAPARVWTRDPGADPHEKRLLGQLGYEGLLMLPLVVGGVCWGLIEVYRRVGAFSAEELESAERLIADAAATAAA
jgi:GAF domain-containing protein